MIESNRVSVAGQLLPAPTQCQKDLLLCPKGGSMSPPPTQLGKSQALAQRSKNKNSRMTLLIP